MSLLAPDILHKLAAGAFSPLDIAWTMAYWAEGPEFIAGSEDIDEGLVQTWPDEKGTRDLIQATSGDRPSYEIAVPALNNKPALDFSGASVMATAVYGAIAQPITIFVVGSFENPDNTQKKIVSGAVGNLHAIGINAVGTDSFEIDAGASQTGGVADGVPHDFLAEFNGANSILTVEGVGTIGPANAGAQSSTRLYAGGNAAGGQNCNGFIAFIGFLSGLLTAPEKAALRSWAASHYAL